MATEAQREYARKHYQANKAKYKAAARKHTIAQRALLRTVLNEQKQGKPCAVCGGVFPAVCMDYDHAGSVKWGAVSDMVHRGVSKKRMLDEIAKCVLVCSNCHRIRTHVVNQEN